jgi:eukaryotic translation initiation factor 2C
LILDTVLALSVLANVYHNHAVPYILACFACNAVAPISYAHLAAAQVGTFMKFEDMSDASSSQGGHTSAGSVPVPELPRLHANVKNTMFFC